MRLGTLSARSSAPKTVLKNMAVLKEYLLTELLRENSDAPNVTQLTGARTDTPIPKSTV